MKDDHSFGVERRRGGKGTAFRRWQPAPYGTLWSSSGLLIAVAFYAVFLGQRASTCSEHLILRSGEDKVSPVTTGKTNMDQRQLRPVQAAVVAIQEKRRQTASLPLKKANGIKIRRNINANQSLCRPDARASPIRLTRPRGNLTRTRLSAMVRNGTLASASRALLKSRRDLCGACGMDVAESGKECEVDGERIWAIKLCRTCCRKNSTNTQGRAYVGLQGKCAVCPRVAVYGNSSGVPTRCKRHSDGGQMDVMNPRCSFPEGCSRQPSYGYKVNRTRLFCMEHRLHGQTSIKNRNCESIEGCSRRASFRWVHPFAASDSDGKGVGRGKVILLCGLHRKPNSTHLHEAKRCEAPGCGKGAQFAPRGAPVGKHCAQHKAISEVNVRSKKCEHAGCDRSPTFGNAKLRVPKFCKSHKESCMVDVRSRRCTLRPDCIKRATYGERQGMAMACKRHKLAWHVTLNARPRPQGQGGVGRSRSGSREGRGVISGRSALMERKPGRTGLVEDGGSGFGVGG